ncbi:MAG: hypothetical protein HDQ96_12010 [Lachnospiraceae bacterium]|nr:hypothetical protein [Lachnospiraceae bacterium]
METKEMDIEELIYTETEKRLQEMESIGYDFPEKIGRADIAVMLVGFVGSLILIVLCMMGVIS